MKNACNDNEQSTFEPIGLTAERIAESLRQTNKFPANCCSGSISRSSLSAATERPESDKFTVHSDFGVPAITIASAPINTLEARGGPSLSVPAIFLAGGLAQIDNSVVRFVAVDVVDELGGPPSMNIKPSEAMCGVSHPVNPDNAVSHPESTGAESAKSRISSESPDKFTGIRTVIQEFADSFRRNEIVKLAHALEPTEQKQEEAPGDRNASDADKKREEDQRDYVDHRLREISAWERRVNGGRKV